MGRGSGPPPICPQGRLAILTALVALRLAGDMLSPSDADIANIAAAFYDAALDGTLWPSALELLRTAFGAVCASVNGYGLTTGYDAGRTQCFLLNAGCDPEAIESYAGHYATLDPVAASLARRPPGQVITVETALPKAAFVRTAFYNDWVRPQGMWDGLFAAMGHRGRMAAMVAVVRGQHQAEFDGRASAALEGLLPHLGRAVRTTCRLAMAEARGAGVEALLGRLREGALLLGADGAVLYANPAAEALLHRSDGLTVAQGRLRAARPADNAALRRAVATAAARGGGTLDIARPSGRAPFAVAVQPASAGRLSAGDPWRVVPRPAVLAFVVDPDRDGGAAKARTLRELYGLTAAEAAVAGAIAQGQGVTDAAALGVAPSTLRWHLRCVFEKTGTARQAELARLVERLGAVGSSSYTDLR